MISAAARSPWAIAGCGLVLVVRLTPKGGRDAIDGVQTRADGQTLLKARVRAAPMEGEANAALLKLLSGALDIAPGQISIVAGMTARIKRVTIAGDGAALAARLASIVESGT